MRQLRTTVASVIFRRHRLVDVRSRRIRVRDTGRYAGFWSSYEDGRWEQDTFDVLDRFLRPGARYVDIGGWIGPTVLYGAARGARVTAFEPDGVAFKELTANVHSNPRLRRRVLLVNAAVAAEDGRAVLRSAKFGNSESTLASVKVARGRTVVELTDEQGCSTVSAATADARYGFHGSALIKIDIEGGEYDLLPVLLPLLHGSAAALFISFHPHNMGVGLPTAGETAELRRTLSLRMIDLLKGYEASRMVEGAWRRATAADLARESEAGRFLRGAVLFRPRRG